MANLQTTCEIADDCPSACFCNILSTSFAFLFAFDDHKFNDFITSPLRCVKKWKRHGAQQRK